MNEHVIENLTSVENIRLINEAVKEEGFNSIEIYAPFESNKDKIHFLVSSENLNLTMFDQLGLHQKIKEILDVDEIMLDNKASYNDEDLNFYFEERCEFSEENIEKIKNLYTASIVEEKNEPYFMARDTFFNSIEKDSTKETSVGEKRKSPTREDAEKLFNKALFESHNKKIKLDDAAVEVIQELMNNYEEIAKENGIIIKHEIHVEQNLTNKI